MLCSGLVEYEKARPMMAERVTVQQHVSDAALSEVLGAIATAAREIERKIRLAGLSDTYGAAGAVNVQGEQQQKLDVFANDAMMHALGKVKSVAAAETRKRRRLIMLGL